MLCLNLNTGALWDGLGTPVSAAAGGLVNPPMNPTRSGFARSVALVLCGSPMAGARFPKKKKIVVKTEYPEKYITYMPGCWN